MRQFLVLLLLLSVAGCKPRDGETLRQIARKTGEKLEGAATPVNAMTTGVRGSLGEASVAARVEARLRWDRYVAGQRITVRGDGQGKIILSGTVSEPSVKTRAADLARSTVGVESVTDELKVKAAE